MARTLVRVSSAAQRVYMSKDDLKSKGMSPDDAMKDLDAWLRDGPYVDGALKGYLIKDDLVNIMREYILSGARSSRALSKKIQPMR